MSESELTHHLSAMEKAIEHNPQSPVDWLSDVRKKLQQLAAAYQTQASRSHEAQFDQIREQDIALQPRINTMQEEDRRLNALMSELQTSLDGIEPASFKADRITRISKRIQGVVADMRTQQEAISKWFSESLLRDRGVSS